MTFDIFLGTLIIFSAISSLLTEALKKMFENAGRAPSANLIALINAIVIGVIGTIGLYIVMEIPLNITSLVYIIGMTFCVWIGSMTGYDKIIQLIKQNNNKK